MPTSVALSVHFEDFIRQQVKSGRYNNVSEVVRAGLRMLEDQESKKVLLNDELRKAVALGFSSGSDVSGDSVFDRLEEKYQSMSGMTD